MQMIRMIIVIARMLKLLALRGQKMTNGSSSRMIMDVSTSLKSDILLIIRVSPSTCWIRNWDTRKA